MIGGSMGMIDSWIRGFEDYQAPLPFISLKIGDVHHLYGIDRPCPLSFFWYVEKILFSARKYKYNLVIFDTDK
jgi:hypothetical protein